jgi:hypothetical protein
MSGFSFPDLSDAVQNQLNATQLRMLERGELKPDSQTISLFNKAFKLPSDYFIRERTISIEDLNSRKLVKRPIKDLEKILAYTADYLERYMELEEVLGLDNKISFVPWGYSVKNETDVENAALDLRKKWKLGKMSYLIL